MPSGEGPGALVRPWRCALLFGIDRVLAAGVDRALVRVHTPNGGALAPGVDRRRGVKPNLLVIAQGTPTCGCSGGGSGRVLALVGWVKAVWVQGYVGGSDLGSCGWPRISSRGRPALPRPCRPDSSGTSHPGETKHGHPQVGVPCMITGGLRGGGVPWNWLNGALTFSLHFFVAKVHVCTDDRLGPLILGRCLLP
jgi:hypothetical protein